LVHPSPLSHASHFPFYDLRFFFPPLQIKIPKSCSTPFRARRNFSFPYLSSLGAPGIFSVYKPGTPKRVHLSLSFPASTLLLTSPSIPPSPSCALNPLSLVGYHAYSPFFFLSKIRDASPQQPYFPPLILIGNSPPSEFSLFCPTMVA